ncbi:MAG TPA: SDR family oxidoreductase [Solirubrobacteraceae bacterium]|jgi:citronellol/citronellal dehydrogenase|nr:SDR family oxidoreductase [Solirubrobacteraceae bacterium]
MTSEISAQAGVGGPRGPGSSIFSAGMLHGQAALVTGGGTGLGKATALELARCGARVTIAGRREDVLVEAAAEIDGLVRGGGEGRGSGGGNGAEGKESGGVRTVVGDIRERADARAMVGAVLERDRRLDLLVNNAGGQFFSPAELIASKGWRAVWRLNVQGMLNMSEAAFELAFAGEGSEDEGDCGGGSGSRGGRIVNVTLSPHHGMPGMAHSGAARATVEALTRELAGRWTGEGVTVATVAVGTFDTEVMVKYPAAVRAGMSRSVPVQRLGTPEEHAWLVALLASPVGGAFNGSTVTLDGARDNWFGPWPPAGLVDEAGEVPVEERR